MFDIINKSEIIDCIKKVTIDFAILVTLSGIILTLMWLW